MKKKSYLVQLNLRVNYKKRDFTGHSLGQDWRLNSLGGVFYFLLLREACLKLVRNPCEHEIELCV